MAEGTNYISLNRALWNKRTAVHYDSEFYDTKSFIEGRDSLNQIEKDLLGKLDGKSVLHLQCHFGQDTISMSRLGAKTLGVDFSDAAIEKATALAKDCNSDAQFVCCDIYSLPRVLAARFDVVFSSYGTIGWLPDIDEWASVISFFLKPGGKFVFAEFHPVVWMFEDDFQGIKYPYSNFGPILESESGTYADRNAAINSDYVMWNHGLAEVLSALRKYGLTIDVFQEFDYSPYNCFNGTEEFEPGKFRIKHLGNKIPMVYALVARKEF